jgi:hypothetical protein
MKRMAGDVREDFSAGEDGDAVGQGEKRRLGS